MLALFCDCLEPKETVISEFFSVVTFLSADDFYAAVSISPQCLEMVTAYGHEVLHNYHIDKTSMQAHHFMHSFLASEAGIARSFCTG